MSFVIIGDHDRIRHGLSNDFVSVILDGEDDLKPKFLILMSAIASNPHGKLNLQGPFRKCRWGVWVIAGDSALAVLCRFGPLLDFIRVEDNDTLLLVLLKQFLFIRLLLLLARRPFSLSLYASGTNLDFSALQWLLLIVL